MKTKIFSIHFLLVVCALTFANTVFAQLVPFQLEITTAQDVFPGQEFEMNLTYKNSQNVVIKDFVLNHEQLNHTVITSRDLDTFAHIHPQQTPQGNFLIKINSDTVDTDNIDAANAVSKPGTYFVWSELKPLNEPESLVARSQFLAHGKETLVPLVADTVIKNKITKYFKYSGDVGQKGDAYRLTLDIRKMQGMIHLVFNIEEWVETSGVGSYNTISDLQKWLGMAGHGILISEAGADVFAKEFRHLHVASPEEDGGHHHHSLSEAGISAYGLQMIMTGDDIPPKGVYKLWSQFKHKGKVRTFPFVIKL